MPWPAATERFWSVGGGTDDGDAIGCARPLPGPSVEHGPTTQPGHRPCRHLEQRVGPPEVGRTVLVAELDGAGDPNPVRERGDDHPVLLDTDRLGEHSCGCRHVHDVATPTTQRQPHTHLVRQCSGLEPRGEDNVTDADRAGRRDQRLDPPTAHDLPLHSGVEQQGGAVSHGVVEHRPHIAAALEHPLFRVVHPACHWCEAGLQGLQLCTGEQAGHGSARWTQMDVDGAGLAQGRVVASGRELAVESGALVREQLQSVLGCAGASRGGRGSEPAQPRREAAGRPHPHRGRAAHHLDGCLAKECGRGQRRHVVGCQDPGVRIGAAATDPGGPVQDDDSGPAPGQLPGDAGADDARPDHGEINGVVTTALPRQVGKRFHASTLGTSWCPPPHP